MDVTGDTTPGSTGAVLDFFAYEDPEGGYTARAVGLSIFTEADDLPALRDNIRDAVRCHFGDGEAPAVLRLHVVREEVIAL
ncbi:MAG: 2-oxoisovalerate dehydrogenase [Dehalococcoidia bacterium]